MSFFEPPPPAPAPPQQSWRQPAWLGPPDNEMGGVVALGLVVARSQQAAVWIDSATAFPSGVQFAVELRWRPEMVEIVSRGAPWYYGPSEGGELPDELFRAGFQFADGSKVTTLGGPGPAVVADSAVGQEPEGPLLVPRGGGGGSQSWSHGLWLWPLPKEEPLSFVCEWPALGITLTRAVSAWRRFTTRPAAASSCGRTTGRSSGRAPRPDGGTSRRRVPVLGA